MRADGDGRFCCHENIRADFDLAMLFTATAV
jgi:hypothetical protein